MAQLPTDFTTKYTRLLGEEAPAFFATFDDQVEKAYRVNPLKAHPVVSDTPDNGPVPYGKWGHFGAVSGHSVDHVTGVVYSQEPSAQFVGEVLQPKPGERVLDLAAAPGGKTTHLAAFMQQEGLLWANEIFMNRAKVLSENIERMGVKNSIVSSHAPAELSAKLPQFFDKILLDAPCSGEGMFRKNPAAVAQWHQDFPKELADLQREILQEAMKMLRPGGQIVYSTCTFAPEEDEQMIAWLMQAYPEMQLVPIDKPAHTHVQDGRPAWADAAYTAGETATSTTTDMTVLKGTARLWPQALQGEGHFAAKLEKAADATATTPSVKPLVPTALSRSQEKIFADFVATTLRGFDVTQHTLTLFGDRLYMAPSDTPDISGMKILRLGLELGTFKKNRFEPAHALALALSPQEVTQTYAMTPEDWAQFVHGDVVRTTNVLQKGWVLMTANGNGAGWGRYVDGQIKNFFPKGLRFAVKADGATLAPDMY